MVGTVSAVGRALVRRHVSRNQNATIKLLRGDVGAMDPVTLKVPGLSNYATLYGPGIAPYNGQARIHPVSGEGSIATGEGDLDLRQVVVSIPWDAPMPARDDVVQVVQDTLSDGDLTGATFRVVEVSGGSLFGDARRMSCTLWGRSRYWTGKGGT